MAGMSEGACPRSRRRARNREGNMMARTCRVCGCTEDNACVDDGLTPCHWVAEDLCSECVDVPYSEGEERLLRLLCCCASDHEVRAGGTHLNCIQTEWLAQWPYCTVINVLVPESKQYPLAMAVVCDRCLEEQRQLQFVIAGDKDEHGEAQYRRVPVAELKTPEIHWPDLHPDRVPR